MHTIRIQKISQGIFRIRTADTPELLMLGDFLASRVNGFDHVKRFLAMGPESDYNAGVCVADRNYDMVTIYNIYDDNSPEFKISYHQLIKLIDDWLIVCRQLPKEIIITTEDQSNFTVKGIN